MASFDNQSDFDDGALLSSINITPFVDVVLVLLVIFMVTTPILMKDLLDINLPQTKSSDGARLNTLGIALNKQAQIILNGTVVSEKTLAEEIKKYILKDKNTQAIISADIELNYGVVVNIIDIIKSSGLEKFALQIEKKSTESQ